MPVNHIFFFINKLHECLSFVYLFLWSDFHLEEALDWPGLDLKLGQVSGLAVDPENNLVIFHRGDHVWDEE